MKKMYYMFLMMLTIAVFSSCMLEFDSVTISYSGQIDGYLEDCGCPSNNAGGLARRYYYISQRSRDKSKLLQLDSGGYSKYDMDPDGVRTKAIIEIYKKMGMDAVNVTSTDLETEMDRFLEISKDHQNILLSANLIKEDGTTIFNRAIEVEKNGVKFGIVGVTKHVNYIWKSAKYGKVITSDPIKAAQEALSKISEKVEVKVLLIYMPRKELLRNLEHLSGYDIIIGSDKLFSRDDINQNQKPFVSYPGTQGKYAGILKICYEKGELKILENNLELLSVDKEEDMVIKDLVEKWKEKIDNRRKFILSSE